MPVSGGIHTHVNDTTGLAIDTHCVGRIGENLQDAVIKKATDLRLAREGSMLKELIRAVNLQNDTYIHQPANQIPLIGAVGCVAYIPSVHATTAPDAVIIANTGDAHAMLFKISGQGMTTLVEPKLLTRNHPESFNFFSTQNLPTDGQGAFNKNAIQKRKNIYPTIERHTLNRAALNSGDKVFLGLFTDGALPGIDFDINETDTMSAGERNKIFARIAKHENDAASIVRAWAAVNGNDLLNAPERLAPKFIERARDLDENDCATAMFIDITAAPAEKGVKAGVFDGHHAPGSGQYARKLAFTVYNMA